MNRTAENSAALTADRNVEREPVKFETQIGSCTYTVSIGFSDSARETIEDKILRLVMQEVANDDNC
jgi:hypothetical protein